MKNKTISYLAIHKDEKNNSILVYYDNKHKKFILEHEFLCCYHINEMVHFFIFCEVLGPFYDIRTRNNRHVNVSNYSHAYRYQKAMGRPLAFKFQHG